MKKAEKESDRERGDTRTWESERERREDASLIDGNLIKHKFQWSAQYSKWPRGIRRRDLEQEEPESFTRFIALLSTIFISDK